MNTSGYEMQLAEMRDRLEAGNLREAELSTKVMRVTAVRNGLSYNLAQATQERDAALNAFERFRNAAKRHAPLYLIDVEAGTSDPSSALAERARATVQAVIEFMDKQLCVSDSDIERIRSEFGLTKP